MYPYCPPLLLTVGLYRVAMKMVKVAVLT